jgi:hypothetical protein
MKRSFRGLMLILGIFCSLSLAVAAPVAAQTDEDIDIAAIGEDVLAADPDTLLEGLEEPMRDRDLPEGFSEAEFVAEEDVTPEMGLLGSDSLEGALGSVAYSVVGDVEVLGGANAIVSVQYVAFDADELTDDTLDEFIEGAESGLGELPEGSEATVETVELAGEDAALITFSQTGASSSVVVEYIAIPVGNVFVFASVTIADTAEVDADDVFDATEALALSSITHLGEVAADS